MGPLGYHAHVRKASLLAVLLAACAAAQRPSAGAEGPALASREVLARFASAVDEGRWPEAWTLLSARWRARETPERLAADLAASGPVGTSAVARAKAALAMGALPEVNGRSAALAVGQGKAAVLLLEDGSWRVDALE
jgi:hypothetical protein